MRIFILIIVTLLTNSDIVKFPEKKNVLVKEFAEYENFFSLATLDLNAKGITDKIHILYVSFNYQGAEKDLNFPNEEDMDHFTFQIEKNGLYRPTFKKEALKMESQYKPYFLIGKEKFQKAKSENFNVEELLTFSDKPGWLQNDATPINSKGKEFTFICQMEIETFAADDSLLYIFYDKYDRQVKYIYQRT